MNLPAREWPIENGAELNRRRISRYSVQVPVTFAWDEGDHKKRGDGWTRDLNGKGAYIYSSSLPPIGSRARVQVILPPLGEAGRILSIYMDASILRVDSGEQEPQKSGFAVQSKRVILRAGKEGDAEEDAVDFGST